ncbi:MAG: hypothetical protein AAF702_38250 [Chloroflexota bacterium]
MSKVRPIFFMLALGGILLGFLLVPNLLATVTQETAASTSNPIAILGDGTSVITETIELSDTIPLDDRLTRDEMLAADELDVEELDPTELAPSDEDDDFGVLDGEEDPDPVVGEVPDPDAEEEMRRLFAEEWAGIAEEDPASLDGTDEDAAEDDEPRALNSSAGPFDGYYAHRLVVNSTASKYPYTAIGKLFFKVPGNSGWSSCTATVIGRRALITAGHCLYTRGKGWHQDVRFYPAYQNGYAPWGEFRAQQLAVLSGWFSSSNFAYDVGVAIMKDRSGRRISQWTGYLGYMYNFSAKQHFHVVGYPGNVGNGRWPIICAGQTQRRASLSGPDPVGIACHQTFGSSGGPWIVNYKPRYRSASNYVNSVVSYGQVGTNRMYGPYFDTNVKNLIQWARSK